MSRVLQADARATALMDQRYHAIDIRMSPDETYKRIPAELRPVEPRPHVQTLLQPVFHGEVRGAVALEGLVAAMDAECEAREDVGEERDGDYGGFHGEGLVEGTGEEEVLVGFGEGAG